MSASVTIERVKCACSDCVCVVDVDKGVKQDGRIYCGEACAEHHKGGAGCNHAGCTCHG
ncbi:MAG: metallothionein [Acetobacteraceae bacterium]|nr:metallothionein [Acetobacteraceae bacterium]